MRTRLVTLTTDVGGPYAAQMKGVLFRTLPPACVVDLALDLPVHGIEEAAFLLRHMGAAFPSGTVHLAVVDPGVGGRRSPVAVECQEGSFLVGPDNGLLAPLADFLGVRKVVRLDPRRVDRAGSVSPTFEGRDVFAPAAARLATGTPIDKLGPVAKLARIPTRPPQTTPTGIRGRVVHADRFGNLITDIPTPLGPSEGEGVRVRVGKGRSALVQRYRTYEDAALGRTMLVGSSFGLLEVSVREGSAARRFHAKVGDLISVGRPARRYR